MQFRALKYGMVFTAIGLGFVSIAFGGPLVFALPAYAFGIVPLAELFFKPNPSNLSKAELEMVREDKLYDWMVYLLVPVQYGLILFFLISIGDEGLLWWEKVGIVWATGIGCGVLGINVAHELGHRHKKYEQFLSKMLLLTSLYMHFFIEHNRGHHANVSTPEDPASSRRGEVLYTFWIRSIVNSYRSAWRIENRRLRKKGISIFSIQNEMLVYQIIQAALLGLIAIFAGWEAMLLFMVAATIGILLLETVNYIEHYGLRREKLASGTYERVRPDHSWNSNHPVGRLLLFELSRHSDHHYRSGRKYQLLRHMEGAPQMPTGYPGMMVLAFLPPIWFRVMHKQIADYRGEAANSQVALA